jgi:hypothetical protein
MTQKFAEIWLFSFLVFMVAAFVFDMAFGLMLLKFLPSPKAAFVFGGIYAALMLGPLFWVHP